jgi:enoyl-CoA hydratase/carnithine racemase
VPDIHIRIQGRAGWITLNRPQALNALTYEMALAIEASLDEWRTADVDLVVLDANGDRGFCAGGDIADMYRSGQQGDLDYGRTFWRDEYRLNATIYKYPKPIVIFLQGFTMGGGVGIGCHGSHRIVGESSLIAMPECGIGLVPDVGGSMILAQCAGHLGEYLGVTGHRMGPADAIHAGFADGFIAQAQWPDVKELLVAGNLDAVVYSVAPDGDLPANLADIDHHFGKGSLAEIEQSLSLGPSEFAAKTLKTIQSRAPLAMACCIEIIRRLRTSEGIRPALDQEFRFTHRAVAQGDFIEGIRAAIIDKDRDPEWAHRAIGDLTDEDVVTMLAPLGEDALMWKDTA